MDMSTIFAGISMLLASISLVISVIAWRKTSKYQDYDYAERLELLDEVIGTASPGGDIKYLALRGEGAEGDKKHSIEIPTPTPVFLYYAKLKNVGERAILIDSIFIDYGRISDNSLHAKHRDSGQFYLEPGRAHNLEFNLTDDEVTETMKRLSIEDVSYQLRINYQTSTGSIVSAVRYLGADRLIVAHRGRVVANQNIN